MHVSLWVSFLFLCFCLAFFLKKTWRMWGGEGVGGRKLLRSQVSNRTSHQIDGKKERKENNTVAFVE